MWRHHEQRIEYAVARGDMTISIAVVNHYADHISPICGEIDYRQLKDVTIEGDIPSFLKHNISRRLLNRDYFGAADELDQYLNGIAVAAVMT